MSTTTTTQQTDAVAPPTDHDPVKLRRWLTTRVADMIGESKPGGMYTKDAVVRTFDAVCSSYNPPLGGSARNELLAYVTNELCGYGPIQPLLDDPTVSEVMVNRADRVYAERKGKPVRTEIVFDDDAHVRRVIDKIVVPLGRRVDRSTPLVDGRLPDGSRVNAAIPPASIDGPCITIRKFGSPPLTAQDLIKFGTLTPALSDFFKCCVVARLNIIVAGGTGSGKTTLLNVLSQYIPADERIVTIEDAAELSLVQDHVIRLEAQRPEPDGKGEITIRDLVKNSLRMRPERIVVGECRGGETLDMLQAMNTGHDGSLTTLHANTPRDVISRVETMALMGGIDFPIKVIRDQIASSVDLIIQITRLRDGSRRITHITEIGAMEGDKLTLQDLFRFEEQGVGPDGKIVGLMRPSGLRPQFETHINNAGFKLPVELFSAGGFVDRRGR